MHPAAVIEHRPEGILGQLLEQGDGRHEYVRDVVWWPAIRNAPSDETGGVLVLAFQPPLAKLVVLEARGIAEIDFTAAHALSEIAGFCRDRGTAFARLESVRAQQSFSRSGIVGRVGSSHIYRSVHGPVEALAPGA
ncbi:MAG: hypothetical protein ACREHV_11860 [Rhizomicrobium sp.]